MSYPTSDDTGLQAPAGEPSDVNDQVDAGHEGSTQEPAAPTEPRPEPVETGKVTRLEQEVAKYSKVLQGLGIDPESDFAERFISGVTDKYEIAKALGFTPQAPVTPPAPTPVETLRKLVEKIDREGATEGDIKESLQIMADVIEEQNVTRQQSQVEATINACKNAVFEYIGQDAMHQALPEELQRIENQLFLSSTDQLVAEAAAKSSNQNAYLDPRVYRHYAERNASRLEQLRNYWIEHGKSLATPKAAPARVPTPISPNSGDGPAAPSEVPITLANMRQAAAAYAAQRRQV